MKRAAIFVAMAICSLRIMAQETNPEENNGLIAIHQSLKDRFLEGGWDFMMLTLACLIIGLLVFIRKLYDLNTSTVDNEKFLHQINKNLLDQKSPLSDVKEGRLYRICTAGLEQHSRGFIKVQEAIASALSVERGHLENGLTWLSLFISLAPMLGFMGTVLGMITSFDAIATLGAGDNMSPGLVAGGIKVALITTVSGLVIAVVLQLFYNYLLHKIDIIMTNLEDSCSTFIDILILNQLKK